MQDYLDIQGIMAVFVAAVTLGLTVAAITSALRIRRKTANTVTPNVRDRQTVSSVSNEPSAVLCWICSIVRCNADILWRASASDLYAVYGQAMLLLLLIGITTAIWGTFLSQFFPGFIVV